MFTLKKDIPQLYQWDSNVKLIVEDDRINQVQFSQRFSQTAVCVKVENKECFIPNEFLQSYYDIFAYACIVDNDGQVCEFSDMFSVFARPKPDNYVYTPTEILTLKHIEDELNKKFETLAKEIEDDMETAVRTRPQELTEEEKSQARKNIGAISSEEDRGAYYVTLTKNGNTYTSDKTFKEITDAIKDNLFPYVKLSVNLMPLIGNFGDMLTFGGTYGQTAYEIVIAFNDQVIVGSKDYSPDWEAQLYDGGYIENRTHGKVIYKCDTEEKNPDSFYGSRQLTDSQETYLQSIGASTESSKELLFILPQNDVNFDLMADEYDYDNYEPPSENNTEVTIAIPDGTGVITATPSFTVSEIKTNNILYGWSLNFTDGGFAENYLKCVVMLLKNVPYNGYIRRGVWLPNYTGSPKKGYGCKVTYKCVKKLSKEYLPEMTDKAVSYEPQVLTTEQQSQARQNIGITGIVTSENYKKPEHTTDLVDYSGFLSGSQDILDATVAKSQGTANSGKFLGIGADGVVVPTEVGGGSSKNYRKIAEVTISEEINNIVISKDINGNPFEITEYFVYGTDVKATGATQISTSFNTTSTNSWGWTGINGFIDATTAKNIYMESIWIGRRILRLNSSQWNNGTLSVMHKPNNDQYGNVEKISGINLIAITYPFSQGTISVWGG